MTKRERQIADEYCLNPFQLHRQIAETIGCTRQSVSKALNTPEVKQYIAEVLAEQFKDGQQRALKSMIRMDEQDNNLRIKYQATEFLLKCAGYGIEQKVKVEAQDAINIVINDN